MKTLNLFLVALLALVPALSIGATGDVGSSIKENAVNYTQLAERVLKYADVTMSSSDVDTLNATPVTAVSAPGAGKCLEVVKLTCFNDFSSVTFDSPGGGTIDLRYTDSSGSLKAQIINGFLEATSDKFYDAVVQSNYCSTNAALVLWASSDVQQGNGSIKCRVTYRVITSSDI